MEFDRLCKEVERHFPKHRQMLEEARIFIVNRSELPKSEGGCRLADWQPDEQVIENCRLPFPCIAIADGWACVAVKELSAERREYEIVGLREQPRERLFFHAIVRAFPGSFTFDSGRLGKIVDCRELEVYRNGQELDFEMRGLSLESNQRSSFYQTEGWVADAIVKGAGASILELVDERRIVTESIGELTWAVDGLTANTAYLYLHATILSILLICEPGRFVVEQTPVDMKEPKGKLIRRSQYRPHYIALTPLDIKRRFLYDEHDTEHIPRTPHERRGHFRKLTSERYVAKRNHVIWVKPCWIGKTEGVRGKNKYVVRLDL